MIVKCKNGHYYDNTKHSLCPYCSENQFDSEKMRNDDIKTVAMPAEDDNKTVAMDENDGKTVSFFEESFETEPVVGWFVCVKGAEKGRDYRIHDGRSKIGRAFDNDIVIHSDISISKHAHAEIAYDRKSNKTYLIPMSSIDLLIGSKVVTQPTELHNHDLIKLGQTVLVFVPFCCDEYDWEAIDKRIE